MKNLASDEAPKLRREDLARATLKVGGEVVSRGEFTAASKDTLGKQRVSIMLDAAVLAYFKNKAGDRGYQTLINEALRQSMRSEEMEATLRRVIREELGG
ncbi:MAG: BrnA antitoxin family protein [Pseudohongiella sp.]|nr:BrnA antitoxin family protein [Pseudohongiella sp.]